MAVGGPISARRQLGLCGFIECRRGSTIVEFAIVALPLFLLLVGIVQIAILFLAQEELETAVETAARTLLTGSAQQSQLSQSQFTQSICAQLPSLFTCSDIMVDLETAATFSSANTSSPTLTFNRSGQVTNQWSFEMGSAGSIMVLRVLYQFPIIGPLQYALANLSNSSRLLIATSVFQVEPYAVSGP
jgi:Flp pilus assembly protein TadG